MSSECGYQGDVAKGGKAKAKALKTKASEPDDARTHYNIYKYRELFDKSEKYIGNFISKNVSWEVYTESSCYTNNDSSND